MIVVLVSCYNCNISFIHMRGFILILVCFSVAACKPIKSASYIWYFYSSMYIFLPNSVLAQPISFIGISEL